MMQWKEGHIHLAMRHFLRQSGWRLIAGDYPGGSDHELHPLNVVDLRLATDNSPDPRRHSLGELVPDLVALKSNQLIILEAKPNFNFDDYQKLQKLLGERRVDLQEALLKFARDRNVPSLLPLEKLTLMPVLAFKASSVAPPPDPDFSYLRILNADHAYFEGALQGVE